MLDGFSAETLARVQFAFTVSFHIIFPAFSIGLASYLAVLNGLWMRTRDETYLTLFNYWKKIFAVAFGMGVVSGIVMSYQFGTNWSVFSDKAGPVVGPLMAYEVLSAFFLEAGFLGIMLFGRERVGEKLHMFATAMVAFGTLMSATWILSVNSWMQTPAGFSIAENGQFVPEDWLAIIFNPSFMHRLVHMVLAAYLTTALVVGAVGALHLLRDRTDREARRMFSMAMWMAVIVTPIQIFAGHEHGLNILEHQPVKIMAMEGHYESHPEGWTPLYLFGIPNDEEQRLDYAIGIPGLGNLIFEHPLDYPTKGLDTVPDEDQPPVFIVFWSFRVMVGLGFLMLGLGAWSAWARWRGTLYDSSWLHRASIAMGPTGFVAVLAGWITTEVGRQPFTVYGFLRTSDSLAPVAPVWDGNETWLVLGGGGLFAVFPLAYAIVMPALYMPITLMLLALVFRGVSFEYRWRTQNKGLWDAAFFGGSFVAALCQGIALGALVQGIEIDGRAYGGGWFDWLTPFSVLTGLAVVVGYGLLGATWLIYKTEHDIQIQMRGYAWWLGAVTLGLIGLVSILTPFQGPEYFQRWFNLPTSVFVMIVPLLMLGLTWAFYTGLNDGKDLQPFLSALGFFVVSFIGIGISFYPMMVPPSLTIWDAAAPDSSLAFALVGAVILIPIILGYTAYAYWVFRGKMDPSEGYH